MLAGRRGSTFHPTGKRRSFLATVRDGFVGRGLQPRSLGGPRAAPPLTFRPPARIECPSGRNREESARTWPAKSKHIKVRGILWGHAPHYWALHGPGWDAVQWLTFCIALGTLLSAALIGATALLARDALGDAKRTRHGQMIVDMARQWSGPEIVESRQEFALISNSGLLALVQRLYGGSGTLAKADVELYLKLQRLPDLIETIAVLELEGVVSTRLIHRLWGPVIVGQWFGWRDAIFELRKHDDQDAEGSYLYFQRLAAEMRRLDRALTTGRSTRP